MRDILIEFLTAQLNQHKQLLQDLASFISGLTGEPQEQYTLVTGMSHQKSEPSAPISFFKRDKYTSPDGLLRLVYSRDDPGAAEAYYALLSNQKQTQEGGDNKECQMVSNTQNKEEDTMKYISRRADGRWMARKTINGRRICIYGKTQAEAYEKLKLLNGRKSRRPKPQSFVEFAQWWLVTFKQKTVLPKTYRFYQNIITSHLQIKTPLDKVTSFQLQEIISKLTASRIKEAVCQVIKAITRKAYELDLIKKDVGLYLEKGKIEKGGNRRALNIDEQRKLIGALGDDVFSRRVMFYLCTGARPAEFATVQSNEIRPGWVKINGTKTKGATRWVKISDKLSSILANASPEFFKFDLKRFREHLQRFCTEHGICENIDIYTLRHTFATNLYILRIPEKDRQIYMGHAPGSTMTNGVYTTFSPDTTAQDIYNIFGDWFPKF